MEILVSIFCRMTGAFKKFLVKELDDILLLIGVYLVSYGVYQIYIPAGYIVLGIFFLLAAVIWSKGTGGNKNDFK